MPPVLVQALTQIARSQRTARQLTMADDTPPADLTTALRDAVSLFRELGIGYALVGGFAAMVYGRARFTEDVDFVAEPGHEDTLADHPEVMRRHGFDPESTWKLYHRSGIDIDLWKDKHAADIVTRAVRRKLDHRFARVAEVHDLVAMKLRADRPQDDYDISEILKHQTLDEALLRRRVTAAQFKHFTAIKRRTGA